MYSTHGSVQVPEKRWYLDNEGCSKQDVTTAKEINQTVDDTEI